MVNKSKSRIISNDCWVLASEKCTILKWARQISGVIRVKNEVKRVKMLIELACVVQWHPQTVFARLCICPFPCLSFLFCLIGKYFSGGGNCHGFTCAGLS